MTRMTQEQLREKLSVLQVSQSAVLKDISEIREQLLVARERSRQTQDYSDSEWFHSATRALREKEIRHQRILSAIGATNRRLKAWTQSNETVVAEGQDLEEIESRRSRLAIRNAELLKDIAVLKDQIGRAKGEGAQGRYSDAKWFRSASRALAEKQVEHQALQREIGEARRQAELLESLANQEERARVEESHRRIREFRISQLAGIKPKQALIAVEFMRLAHDVLAGEQFRALFDQAKATVEAKEIEVSGQPA